MPSGTSPCRREADNGPKTARPPPSPGRVSRGDSYRGGIGTAPRATPQAQGHRVSTRREGQAGGSEVLSTGLDPGQARGLRGGLRFLSPTPCGRSGYVYGWSQPQETRNPHPVHTRHVARSLFPSAGSLSACLAPAPASTGLGGARVASPPRPSVQQESQRRTAHTW